MAGDKKASDKCRAFIHAEEGFCETPTLCFAGYSTIGYGHKVEPNDPILRRVTGVPAPIRVTREQADKILAIDLERFENAVNKLSPEPNQDQFDALVSLAFNIGVASFSGSTLARLWPNSANYMLLFSVARNAKGVLASHPVLAGRRWRERRLFLGLPKIPDREAWKECQAVLERLGFEPGKIDGVPGPRTMAAYDKMRTLIASGGDID